MGNMYVADKDNYRIQLFMAGQSEGITIAGVTNVFGNNSTLLYQPWSIRLDNQLNLYVADFYNHRIQKFNWLLRISLLLSLSLIIFTVK